MVRVFSCGWHITRDGQDRDSPAAVDVAVVTRLARARGLLVVDGQVEARRRIFASDRRARRSVGTRVREGGQSC